MENVIVFLFFVILAMQIPLFIMIIAIEKFIDIPTENLKKGVERLLISSSIFVISSWIYIWLFLVADIMLHPILVCAMQVGISWIKSFIVRRKIDKDLEKDARKKETQKITRRLTAELVTYGIYIILFFIMLLTW